MYIFLFLRSLKVFIPALFCIFTLHLPPTFSFHLQYFSISPLTSPLPAASSFSHDTSNILSLPFTPRTLVLHSLAALPRGSLSRPIKGLPHVIYFYPYFIFSLSFVASSSTNCEMIPMSRFFPLRREGDVKKLAHVGTLEEEKKWRRMSSLARLDRPRLPRPLGVAGAWRRLWTPEVASYLSQPVKWNLCRHFVVHRRAWG